ncbi:serine hydrolase domain-containing protein [Streptomyces sp. NPDC058947]|uniref:serine hydrolase domain-containing protein n=1 Tax=Streptomyces sp. NPDC058947 TaxID=3346675 RepID=UPI00367819FB
MTAGFEDVMDAFARAQQDDPGNAQLCVYHRGRLVVDLWTTRPTAHGPFGPDHVCLTMSCTKGMTATCVHLLAQRGEVDYDAPVATYWPDFASGGKERITVADVLAHRSGLAAFDPDAPIAADDLTDWHKTVGALARTEPLWEPGTAFAYHAVTFGHLAGEIVRRVDGRSLGQFLADEVAAPLGLDLWIGLPEHEEHRVVPQTDAGSAVDPDLFLRLLADAGFDTGSRLIRGYVAAAAQAANGAALNRREMHAAQIPAGNGIANARSLARMYAALIGPVDGVRLLNQETVDEARAPQTDHLHSPAPLDRLPAPFPLRFGLGYELHRTAVPMLGPGSFGHSGAGGRLAFAHPERLTAVGYTCTRMAWDFHSGPDTRWLPWTEALENSLSRLGR